MSDIRFVISDVDGTLVDSDKSLADATVAAAGRLRAAGIPFTLISARPPSGIYWIAEKLDLKGPLGAFNGGTLFDADGTIRERHVVPGDLVRSLLDLYAKHPVSRWLFADGHWYATDGHEGHIAREVKSANQQPVLDADWAPLLDRVDKLVAVSDDHDLLKTIASEAKAIAGDRATIVRSQPYYLDTTARAANKGDGVTALSKMFAVPLDATAVFGDQANDVAMFRRAGFSVAMGQADDDVKAEADEVSTSNDDDGVAHAIDQFILKDCS